MSTTAEYYIRNMSTTEFEGFYNRLRSTDRAATIQKIREEMDRGLARAMAEERGQRTQEMRALRDGVDALRGQLEERAACNARMSEALTTRLEDFRRQGDEQHARATRALQLLRAETIALRGHVEDTRAHLQEVDARARAVERAVADDRANRAVAAQKVGDHAAAMRALATDALASVSLAEVQRVGLVELRTRAITALEQAKSHEAAGAREAAAATLSAALRTADELSMQVAARQDDERANLASVALSLAAARSPLTELEVEDVRRFLGGELARHAAELKSIEASVAHANQPWHERKATLDEARARATRLGRETGALHARYEELVQQAAARESVLQGLVGALVEVWGSVFEMDVDYAVRGDASSPISFKTKRGPYAPNVQATIALDGRMEVHFTGYRGTECASDLEAVRQAMRRSSTVQLAEGAVSVEPGRPNPPDVGPVDLGPVRLVADTSRAAPTPGKATR